MNLKDWSSDYSENVASEKCLESSPFLKVRVGEKTMIVKKSSFCWLFNNRFKVSSDRLSRVKEYSKENIVPRINYVEPIRKANIFVGEWCAFKDPSLKKNDHCFLFGCILAFSYLTGNNRSMKYSLPSAPTEAPTKDKKHSDNKGLGCLSNFYKVSSKKSKEPIVSIANLKNQFLDVKNYVCHIPEPIKKEDSGFIISKSMFTKILELNESSTSSNSKKSPDLCSDSEEEVSDECLLYQDEDNDPESFSNDEENKEYEIDIIVESYYAIFYDHRWYIGRVVDVEGIYVIIKFLEEVLGEFRWPETKSNQSIKIEKQFLFYGPVNLIGNHRFTLKRSDRLNIIKKYKELKK